MENSNLDRPESNEPETRSIGWAVKQLWNGNMVGRKGWNGKGQYLFLVNPGDQGDRKDMSLPFVAINTVQGETVPWLCSQTDLLATDWEVIT